MTATFIFGHKNPDTDSVASAIALSYLKNHMGSFTKPCVLGNLNKESAFILNYFKVDSPFLLKNVKTQIKDIEYERQAGISKKSSILSAYKLMEEKNLKTIPVIDEQDMLLGLITMKDIAMELIRGNFYNVNTSLDNIATDLRGEILVNSTNEVKGKVSVIAYYYKSIEGALGKDDIIIVGDRYDIIEHAINSKVQLIILTGNKQLPNKYIENAREKNVNVMSVPIDTYSAAKLINQCNYVASIMKSKDIIKFNSYEYLEEIKDEMLTTNFKNYPIIDDDDKFLGFINRRHLLNPGKKKVILVDHNEYAQSAEGLQEAEILEIIDHHKIGDISTSMPISFRNLPVGSTCTIVQRMFKEQNVSIPFEMAGILLSGIISDTLLFKSPTTTALDKEASDELNKILKLDIENYAMEMFKAGTSLDGYSIEEIFFKDFKEFILDGNRTGMGQIFTLNIDVVLERRDDFVRYIDNLHDNMNYYLTLFLITDIINEGSYLLYKCDNANVIPTAFNTNSEQGVYIENLVSRKKQVVPKILDAINLLK